MLNVLRWLKKEIIHSLPAVIFFIITFNLISATENLMLRPEGIVFASFITATIAALVVGKAMILIDALPILNAFPHKPLTYNILWKTFVYSSFSLLFRILDRFIKFSFHSESFYLVHQKLSHLLTSPRFWAIQIWLILLFFIYVIFSEFTQVLGKDRVKQILFNAQEI